MTLGRNAPCHCGSGKKYKNCHLELDQDARRAFTAAFPTLAKKNERLIRATARLRDEFGVHVNYVSPVMWQGRKVWAIGSRMYPGRPPTETFHEFLIHVLRQTFGEPWRREQEGLPSDRQHVVMRCSEEYARWTVENATPDARHPDGRYVAPPNGWVQYFLSLAWDVASLIHASNLPTSLITRLRDARAFQGARYELAIAAVFARLDCDIRFLDDEDELRREKHVEFVATHRPTGEHVAVEAKSRRRSGVLNEEGERDATMPLRGDARGVRRLFVRAITQAPEGLPFLVFIDINAPPEAEDASGSPQWQRGVQRWMDRMPAPTATEPAKFNALYVTNFSPHYLERDPVEGGDWLGVTPTYSNMTVAPDLVSSLDSALSNYHRVPSLAEDGALYD